VRPPVRINAPMFVQIADGFVHVVAFLEFSDKAVGAWQLPLVGYYL
jgi:hypothetical protein